MNKADIIKLYLERQKIKEAIHKHYVVHGIDDVYIRRGDVISTILEETGLPRSTPVSKHITEVLVNMGVRPSILRGRKNYRGISLKD